MNANSEVNSHKSQSGVRISLYRGTKEYYSSVTKYSLTQLSNITTKWVYCCTFGPESIRG
jgi:hypothetical protein